MRNTRTLILVGAGTLALTATVVAEVPGQVETILTSDYPLKVTMVATGLEHPWGVAALPDGGLLVTERAGRLRQVAADGTLSEPLAGTPEVYAQEPGGLLDVALDPDFENNQRIWLSFAEPGETAEGTNGASTAMGYGRLTDSGIEDFVTVFSQEPKMECGKHFGGRIVFVPEGQVFLTTGERFLFEPAQGNTNHLGTVVRVNQDGSVPEDNPFASNADALPEIWSYGHRNIQAAAIDPDSGELWVAEMGPLGGDGLNMPEAGKNYGWPEVSWGVHYDGRPIDDPTTRPEFEDAVTQWSPVIAPSGMAFYEGGQFPEWQGDIFIGGLVTEALIRLEMEGGQVSKEEIIPLSKRVRDVEVAPDGSIIVAIDEAEGDLWRLEAMAAP